MDGNDIMELLGEITIKTGFPVPINKTKIFEWTNTINMERKGDVYLYTGALYQLIPYINYTVKFLDAISKLSGGDSLINLAKTIIKVSPYYLSSIIKPDIKEINENNAIVRNIAKLLLKINKNIAYLYEDDIYSGVLLYDMGLDDYFLIHSKKVFQSFKKRNVKKIITIDPHTTHVMREGYPKFIDNFDIEVFNYLELLSNTNIDLGKLDKTLTIHDPCVYSRYENIIDQPRKLLKSMGIRIKEPKRSGKNTFCCGGPLESLSPKFSEDIAKTRMNQLLSESNIIITMCPICKANLSRVKPNDAKLVDISEILSSNI
ncbi:Fe-S oxidoreductase [Caldisphaera lagunensis DSM 15908]|uniref:Fe-S oxidoreductase n=1 Tax=Caldisphaera lagunensis (strain DSM 15908 / JCM 11604 / ANMR 0165 / IC-154) TaxID=1056495 RepID=L0AA83_CALLD|nr:(Fe-S)-binding protein [Caldisphaera lagunensis]AFZ70032.1 Fe-S oxidoreductase [Caldisphaera lagunensis DSM 15908]